MPRSDTVVLEVGGEILDVWTNYSVDSDLFTPADGFKFAIAVGGTRSRDNELAREKVRDLCREFAPVRIYVATKQSDRSTSQALQMTGFIDSVSPTGSRENGTVFEIEGRDLAMLPADSSAPLSLLRRSTRFVDVVAAALAPWPQITIAVDQNGARDLLTGRARTVSAATRRAERERVHGVPQGSISRTVLRRAQRTRTPVDEIVSTGTPSTSARGRSSNGLAPGDVQRLSLRDAKPRAGEMVWDFLDRHAKRLGLLMWMSPRGELILGSPRYDQPPIYRIVRRYKDRPEDPNNVEDARIVRDSSRRISHVTVYGRTSGDDAERAAIQHTAIDPDVPFERFLAVHDQSVRTAEEAERRALRELNEHKAKSLQLEYTMNDHGQGPYVFAIDTIARVEDEVADVSGDFYVVKRTLSRDREKGTKTSVTLVEKGSIVL